MEKTTAVHSPLQRNVRHRSQVSESHNQVFLEIKLA